MPTSLPVSAQHTHTHTCAALVSTCVAQEFEAVSARKTSTRHRGLSKANWTAAKRRGAKYAFEQRAPMACRSSGSLRPEPGTGTASASCRCSAVVSVCGAQTG